ncbi:MAG: hypothetical protein PHX68_04955 [Alphaproteobacteria bacterium]|nr:hypothetical protein [Alphaproteobacteria bacterium]
MDLLSDAAAFIRDRAGQAAEPPAAFALDTPESRASFVAELRRLYENATRTEIERALDRVLEQMDGPYARADVLAKIRVKLED